MPITAIIAPNSYPIPPIRGGGIQTVISEVTPYFKEFKPYIFSNCEFGIDKLPSRETDGNIEHRRICLSSWSELKTRIRYFTTKNYFPYVFEIIKQIKEIKPDIVHVMNRPWFLPILRKYLNINSKMILHHHNLYFSEMNEGKVRGYLNLFDAFAGISRYTVDKEIVSRFPFEAEKCFTIYNGINLNKFKLKWLNMEKRNEIRGKFNIAEDEIVLVFAGRLRKEKGAHTLLKAANKIISVNNKVKIMIVGSHFYMGSDKMTPYIESLGKLAAPIIDNVIFTGFIPPSQMPDIYAASDILVVPSHTEAFGLTYAEAGACGLPVIGTKVGGIPEVVDNGTTGFLMNDPENDEELAHQIKYFINNPDKMKVFGESGRKRVEKHFSAQASAAATEEMYKKVMTFPNRS
jgi:spore coat protein SA